MLTYSDFFAFVIVWTFGTKRRNTSTYALTVAYENFIKRNPEPFRKYVP